jgi:hypothetical protein
MFLLGIKANQQNAGNGSDLTSRAIERIEGLGQRRLDGNKGRLPEEDAYGSRKDQC